jgi:hypothetical protein
MAKYYGFVKFCLKYFWFFKSKNAFIYDLIVIYIIKDYKYSFILVKVGILDLSI